jgi:protein gp37
MSDHTGIAWTDATWNPVTGCSKVSPGCAHCYAEALSHRFWQAVTPWTPANAHLNVRLHPERLDEPLHWRKPRRVFVCSMSDLFHPLVPWRFIDDVFDVMDQTPRHTYQVLTKRPDRMRDIERLAAPNVWLGVSIENDRWVRRADLLRRTPAAVRFVSAEPLLGPLPSLDLTDIDWLIIGGESGPKARPMKPEWALDLIGRAHDAAVAVFVKQGSGPRPGMQGDLPDWAFALREYPA